MAVASRKASSETLTGWLLVADAMSRDPEQIAADLDLYEGTCVPKKLLREAAEALRRPSLWRDPLESMLTKTEAERDALKEYNECLIVQRDRLDGYYEKVKAERDALARRLGECEAGIFARDASLAQVDNERDALIAAIEKAIPYISGERGYHSPEAAVLILRDALPERVRQQVEQP